MPVDVGDDSRVCSQRMNERRIARSPCDHFNQLTGGYCAVFLRLLTNGPFGRRNFMLGVSMEFSQKIVIVHLIDVQFLQCQMPSENVKSTFDGGWDRMTQQMCIPAGQQHPLARPVNRHRCCLQIAMCSRPGRLSRHTWCFTIVKCFRE